ncbi:unnamed protein product [Plutella xylostella]|uniref:(diamondback moth) hypothetical protein n=1 Tax=Plutella xylostella TaxID=51655 RepID=A0A8S4G505_PLUXY|nr:tetratricopeptide repeat protein 5 [Plutella xylostella]CAG9136165.1 unnamed protein product [Plutella xylostella]
MANEPDAEPPKVENFEELMEQLSEGLAELYKFRDYFFDSHPIEMAAEKTKLVKEQMNILEQKFSEIDENEIPTANRAQYLYMKGRLYNIMNKYDPRATHCLSKAVKLSPRLVGAWNELGESYWKNMNIKDAKSSFEGALKHERNTIALRCLSIILRQESSHSTQSHCERKKAIQQSVDYAKEAVSLNTRDGVSWSVLGNSHLCQYFLVAQDPAILKSCMSAYKQATSDTVARGQPDLYYNYGVALKYDERYADALDCFDRACRLDPPWEAPANERARLRALLQQASTLVKTKGKLKAKKLQAMVQSIDQFSLEQYPSCRKLTYSRVSDLTEGKNAGRVFIGKVVGSIHTEGRVPFSFALVDADMACCGVSVYNWADGRGVIIGDTVVIPAPTLRVHQIPDTEETYKSIRVDNPMELLVNGKKIGREQCAGARVTSTYEIH